MWHNLVSRNVFIRNAFISNIHIHVYIATHIHVYMYAMNSCAHTVFFEFASEEWGIKPRGPQRQSGRNIRSFLRSAVHLAKTLGLDRRRLDIDRTRQRRIDAKTTSIRGSFLSRYFAVAFHLFTLFAYPFLATNHSQYSPCKFPFRT